MTRIISLTVRLKMEVESDAEPDDFISNLSHLFSTGLGERLASNAEEVEVVALHDPEGTLTRMPFVEAILHDFDAAASVWDIHDVLEICPRLSREDALMVLRSVTDRHDCHSGIQHCSFTDAIEDVLGINPVTGRLLDNTLPSESRNE